MDIRVECVTPDGLSGKKRVWFRGIFHLIGILGESPFVSKLRKAESAQHSVPEVSRDNAVDRWVHAAFFELFLSFGGSRFQSFSSPAASNANRWALRIR